MLCIRMISGEEVAAVPLEEASSAREVKRLLHHVHGLPPRFQQRLVLNGASLDDADKLDSPVDLELVVVPFSSASQAEVDELIEAACNGSVKQVESLLQLPQDPNVANNGTTALMLAAHRGHVEVVRLLLEAGADKEVADRDGTTALMRAARWGRSEVVRLLLEAGADKEVANNEGATALIMAAGAEHLEVLRLLLEAGADKEVANDVGDTALMRAALCGHVKVVRLLLEAGTDKDMADNKGDTA